MAETPDTPASSTDPLGISVNASATPEQLGSALRALLIAVGGYMVGKGWIDSNIAAAVTPVLMIVGPMLYSQFRVWKTHDQRVSMADRLPDKDAKVVGS